MIHQHTLQTAAAFDRIDDALRGKTDDSLSELIEDLEFLLYKAKEIQDVSASMNDGCDYEPITYCNIPNRQCASCRTVHYLLTFPVLCAIIHV